MADITKKLILKAKLDDQELKQQIQQLKQQLGGGLEIKGQDLSSFQMSFKKISQDFTKQLQDAVSNIQIKVKGGKGGGRSGAVDLVAEQAREMKKADAERLKVIEKIEAAEKKLKTTEYDLAVKAREEKERQERKLWAQKEKLEKTARQKREKEELKLTKKLEAEKVKAIKTEEQEREKLRAKQARDERQLSGLVKKLNEESREEAASMPLPGSTILPTPGSLQGRGGRLLAGAGVVAGVGAGIQAATYGGIGIYQQAAEFRYRQMRDIMNNRALEGIARAAGRQRALPAAAGAIGGGLTGGVLGGLAGAGATAALTKMGIGLTSTGVGAMVGIPMIATAALMATKGYFGARERMGEAAVEQVRPGIEAYQTAKGALPLRFAGLAGLQQITTAAGGLGRRPTELLDLIGRMGEKEGFGYEQAMQTLIQGREFLGTKAVARPDIFRYALRRQLATGTPAVEQFRAAETFAGAGAPGMKQGFDLTYESLKKAVAAGLDISKTGQFMKSTQDYIITNVGFAQMNVEEITTRLAQDVAAFARAGGRGPGETTRLDIMRAQRRQQVLRRESTAQRGLAGLGNILGIQQALGPGATPGQFLQALNISKDARLEDIIAMGFSREQAIALKNLKGGEMTRAKGAIGGGGVAEYLAAMERGLTQEQQRGMTTVGAEKPFTREEIQAAKEKLDQESEAARGTKEFKKSQQEAEIQNTKIIEGMKFFETSIVASAWALERFTKAIKDNVDTLTQYFGEVDLNVGGNSGN